MLETFSKASFSARRVRRVYALVKYTCSGDAGHFMLDNYRTSGLVSIYLTNCMHADTDTS